MENLTLGKQVIYTPRENEPFSHPRPATVVHVWNSDLSAATHPGMANLQVLLDGANDVPETRPQGPTFWATSIHYDPTGAPGTYAFPESPARASAGAIAPASLNFAKNDADGVALLTERFTYKPWTAEQVADGKEITAAAIAMGTAILATPPGPTRTRALNLIEEARMLANANITHAGKF